MKYNPITKELFTDDGTLLKKLYCPLDKDWESMMQTSFLKGKMCDHCQMTVLDTVLFTQTELQELMNSNSQTCLKVDLNQDNLTVTYQ